MNMFDIPLEELRDYRPEIEIRPDFDRFWDDSAAASAIQPLKAEMERVPYPVAAFQGEVRRFQELADFGALCPACGSRRCGGEGKDSGGGEFSRVQLEFALCRCGTQVRNHGAFRLDGRSTRAGYRFARSAAVSERGGKRVDDAGDSRSCFVLLPECVYGLRPCG